MDFDLVFLQEPHIDFLNNTRALQQWRVIYPPKHKDSPTRTHSATLTHTRIATNGWAAIPVNDPDINAILLMYNTGTIHIFNVYNPQDSRRALNSLARATHAVYDQPEQQLDEPQVIWLGDFNRHHPIWEDERNTHLLTEKYLDEAQPLVNLLSVFDLQMLLPPATPTLEVANSKNHTRPDNIFALQELAGSLIRCCTALGLCPLCTNHYPVITELQVNVPHAAQNTFQNFRKTDWPSFRKSLAIRLIKDVPYPDGNIPSTDVFDDLLTQLLQALHDTIDEEVPEM